MNLLVFVLSFLMLIAAISYQGLAHYKNNALIRGIWDRIIRIEDPCAFNQTVEEEYRQLKGKRLSKTEQEAEEKKEESETGGSSKINFRFLTDPSYPALYPKETEQMEALLKNLILLIYGDQPFFNELYQARPTIITDIIHSLRSLSEEMGDKKISKAENLSKIGLKDEGLEKLWYQLLRKNPVSAKVQQALFNLTNEEIQKAGDSLCFQTQLTNYLNNSSKLQIRLYLAPRALLLALLNDPGLVNELIQKRKELYKEVSRKNNPMTIQEAENELKNLVSKAPSLAQFDAIINYRVSKTDPSTYE